jgi:peptidoglycan/xylan/chitin deacetylase (PgdA/CDA1 family)
MADQKPWESQRPGLATKLSRSVTGAVFLSALGVATATWIGLSQPFDPQQQSTTPTILDPSVTRAAAHLPGYPGSIIALTYHGVSDTDHAGSTLSRKVFGQHMAALAAAGYRTVHLSDVEKLLAHQAVHLPPRALLLTFDDGQLTDWTTIDPVLKEYRFNAVGFLTTAKIVEPGTPSYYLSTRQVQNLAATGRWEFGSHSHDLHGLVQIPGDIAPPMTNLILVHGRLESIDQWRARIRKDLARSQSFFRKVLGHPATAFSFPYGERGNGGNSAKITKQLPTLIREAGFGEAFVGENVPTDHIDAISGQSPRWLLNRIGSRATTSVTDLLELIRGSVPVAPPHNLARLPWIGDLATCRRINRALVVESDAYGTCLLTGFNTSQWTDYTIRTRISGITRNSSAVISVRDGAGAGHRGRVEVVVGVSGIIVRQQVGDGDRADLVRAQLPPGGKVRVIQIVLRRNRALIKIPNSKPLLVTFDRRLNEGGVRFEIAAQGKRAVIFEAPTLTSAPAG